MKHALSSMNCAAIFPVIASALPIIFLLSWENIDGFSTPLTQRLVITWAELIFIGGYLFFAKEEFIPKINLKSKFSWVLLGLISIGFINLKFSQNPYASLVRHIEICIHIIFFLCLSASIRTSTHRKLILLGLLSTIFIIGFYFLLLMLATGGDYHEWSTDIPFFSNIRHFGYLQILILPIALHLFIIESGRIKGIAASTYWLTWFFIFWSGGRGSFITAIFIAFFFAPFIYQSYRKVFTFQLLIVISALVCALLLEANHPSLNIARLFFMQSGVENLNADQLSAGRLSIYLNALNHVWTHSPLIGLGADNYRYSIPTPHPVATHPHSFPIQIIYSYGLIGFILLSILIAITLKRLAFRSTKEQPSLPFIILISCLVASLVDGVFYHSFSIICICIVLATFQSNRDSYFSSNRNLRILLFLILIPLTTIWLRHSYTHYLFNKPLSNPQQIQQLKSFPSIISNSNWIDSETPLNLTRQFYQLGKQYGENQCGFSLLEAWTFKPIDEKGIYATCPRFITKNLKFLNHE